MSRERCNGAADVVMLVISRRGPLLETECHHGDPTMVHRMSHRCREENNAANSCCSSTSRKARLEVTAKESQVLTCSTLPQLENEYCNGERVAVNPSF